MKFIFLKVRQIFNIRKKLNVNPAINVSIPAAVNLVYGNSYLILVVIFTLISYSFKLVQLKKTTFKSIRRDRKGNMKEFNIKLKDNLCGEIQGGFFVYEH